MSTWETFTALSNRFIVTSAAFHISMSSAIGVTAPKKVRPWTPYKDFYTKIQLLLFKVKMKKRNGPKTIVYHLPTTNFKRFVIIPFKPNASENDKFACMNSNLFLVIRKCPKNKVHGTAKTKGHKTCDGT